MDKKLRKSICEVAKKAYNEKLVAGTSGNVSAVNREKQIIYITPSNLDYSIMTEDDIMVIDYNGNILSGKHKPSSEWNLHAEIYKQMENVGSVIHTHSPYATAFAVINKNIPVILVEMIPFLKGDIKVAKFAFPGTKEVGDEAVKILKTRNSALLQNHGVVAIGDTPEQAYIRAVYTEDAAKEYHFALQIGVPEIVPLSIVNKMRKKYNLEIEEE